MANKLAKDSILFIYSDGLKDDATEVQKIAFQETRQVLKNEKWCKEVHIVEREINFGLAENVITGVTEILNRYGKIIVLEDDLVTSPYFLDYCNDGLNIYQDSQNVYSINAYQFPIDFGNSNPEAFLCPLATSSWGWATWKSKWDKLDASLEYGELIQSNNQLKKRFDFGSYQFSNMLENKKSWAIKWYYSVFIRNGLGVFTTESLVKNIGFDGTGENCGIEELDQSFFEKGISVQLKENIHLKYYMDMLNYFSVPKKLKRDFPQNKSNPTFVTLKSILKKFLVFSKLK
ncbi:glycosyltransferase family 2 protein [Pedobacter arcticus]|uniref:glycosyltransferase family 2 protein n=1 Tax=Pedobacter arcticus TaxID=752140 RepID=UPI0012B5BC4F|nr:glycosyltransferase family 2 protein [Pedobacter arcticus]